MRTWHWLLGLPVAVVAAVIVVGAPQATEARQVPETLSHRTPVQAGPVEPGFAIDYVGVVWDRPEGREHAHDHGDPAAEDHGAIRFRSSDGGWSPWRPLIEDGADDPDHWASGLVAGNDAEAYQLRGLPEDAGEPRAVALNTTDGPTGDTVERPAGAAALEEECVSREEWGADEELRSDDDAFVFFEAQVTTVHHTATDNDDDDPEATVRAIYEYHTQDRGWDDIGYNYLLDEDGRVYEGRWSGADSDPCAGDGDGTDFAHHPDSDEPVRGAHVGGYNTGNIGVALLGEFTDHPRWGGHPTDEAIAGLEGVLAHLMERHGLDPQGTVDYANEENEEDDVDTIRGHRDWASTECPGERLYDQLPDIRESVAEQMNAPSVTILEPDDGAEFAVGEEITLQGEGWSADGGEDLSGDIAWQYDGEDVGRGETATVTVAEGENEAVATVTDDGASAEDAVTVIGRNDDGDDVVETTVTAVEQGGIGGRNRDRHLDVEVTLATTDGDPVADADVDLVVERAEDEDGSYESYDTATDTTDSDGVASFRFKNVEDGCYRSTVTDVAADPDWDGQPATSEEAFCRP